MNSRTAYDTREVWDQGKIRTFHANWTNPHKGYVYRDRRRVYGSIQLNHLGWSFEPSYPLDKA